MDVSPTSSQHGLHPESYDIMERDSEAKIYHKFFRLHVSHPLLKDHGICPLLVFPFYPLSFQYHHSFTAVDPCLGPLVVSVCLEEEENRLRVILRFHLFHL